MKYILALSIILFFRAGAIAQPTLSAATNNPAEGDAFTSHYCDTTGYSTLPAGGDTGADVAWNYDSLVSHSETTATYMTSFGSAYTDSFPGSNLMSYYNFGIDTTYTYYFANSHYLALTGSYTTNFPSPISPIIKPYIIMSYPMTYGTKTADTSIQLDGGTYYIAADSNFADGYGTLILPTGPCTNVLRVHVKVVQIDSTPGIAGNISFGYNEYYWYKPGFHSCLLSLMYGGYGGGNYLSSIYYYTQSGSPEAITGVNTNTTALEVSPNPAADVVHMKFTIHDPVNTTITLSDVSGRVVGAVSGAQISAGLNDIAYPVSGLAAGVYLVRLSSDGGSVVKQVVVER